MTTSVDVYAQSNPAYLGVVLHEFVVGYEDTSSAFPEYPLLFLPCPIALSNRLARTMTGTNVNTGLAKWYLQSPEAQVYLAEEVRRSVAFSRRALEFDLMSQVLELCGSTFLPVDNAFNKKPKDLSGVAIEDRPFAVAKRFGQWCGQLHSTGRVFALLGLRP